MSEPQHLAAALSNLFSGKSLWFLLFSRAVAGLTAEQAAKIPAPRFNSVWMIVNHINFWQEVILKEVQGIDVDANSFNQGQGFNVPNDPQYEVGWRAACDRALTLNSQLTSEIASFADADLEVPLKSWKETRVHAIHGLIAHNSYHINEIISMQHMNGFWLEET
jgi:hypothetical protein